MKRDLGISKIKIVYIVSGSNGEILGVFGNKKKAHKEAFHHVNKYAKENNFKINSYKKVCEELKGVYNGSIKIIHGYSIPINATIHAIPFNLASIWTN
tara:strand:- start:753 stop:1046 length:294 start_codon:yes stop_codon:yes gene_type:complete